MNRSAMLVIAAAIMILLLIPKNNDRSTELDGKGTWRMQYVSKEFYDKEIEDKGMTWLLLLHNDSSEHEILYYRDVLKQVAIKLDGALRVGAIDCNKYLMVDPCLYKYFSSQKRLPAISVYSYAHSHGERGHLFSYRGEPDVDNLTKSCERLLPLSSKSMEFEAFEKLLRTNASIRTVVLLLSGHNSTPIFWRVSSGLYQKHFLFYHVQVPVSSNSFFSEHPFLRKQQLPLVVGWPMNGEREILVSSFKETRVKSAIKELQRLLGKLLRKGYVRYNMISAWREGMTYLLVLYFPPYIEEIRAVEPLVFEVQSSLGVEVLEIVEYDCIVRISWCDSFVDTKHPRFVVYSPAYIGGVARNTFAEYEGGLDAKQLISFCEDNLPKFSRGIKLCDFLAPSETRKLPEVVLLTSSLKAPIPWRAISGLYQNQFLFYHILEDDILFPGKSLHPNIIGFLPNGKREMLKRDLDMSNMSAAMEELTGILDDFLRKIRASEKM